MIHFGLHCLGFGSILGVRGEFEIMLGIAVFENLTYFLLNHTNPMQSKMGKSSRMQVVNRSIETIQVYSCELYIDSFKISHRGFVFFLWLNQNNQIQSLKYESMGKTTQVKQTLTIGVRVTTKNGKEQPLNTYLKLMSEGQELDQFQLAINTLTSQFRQMQVPMDRGLCVLKARRKQMNITEQQQVNVKGLYRSRNMKYEEKRQSAAGDFDMMQQQLLKIKKQLQDEVYLNNKLKNDRDVLIANKQQLQQEIQKLLVQITKEINVLRVHYDNRITIREHCYEEEIENLVNVFNTENEQNKKIIEFVFKQKHKIEEEIKPLIEKNKKLEIEIRQKNQNISILEKMKLEYERLLKERSQSLEELSFTVQSLGREKQLQDNEMRELKIQISTLHAGLEDNKLVFLNYDERIKELEKTINDYDSLVKSKDDKIKDLQNQLYMVKQREQSSSKQKEMILRQKGYIEQQKQRLLEQIQVLSAKLEQYEHEMEFNQNVMGQLKKQHHQKESELYLHIQNLEQIYAKKMEQVIASFKNEKENTSNSSQMLQKEKEEMESRLKELSNIQEQSQIKMNNLSNEVNSLQSQMKNKKDSIETKDKMIDRLQKEVQKLKSELQRYKMGASGNKLNKTNQQLNSKILELETTIASLQLDINKLKLQIENKDKKIRETQQKMQGISTNEQSLKKTKSLRDLKGEDSYRANQEQMYLLLSEKEVQLNDLKRKVNQLQHLYEHLQLKINLILSKYPNIDMALINENLGQDRCDSEQQEERIINQNFKILGSLKEVPEDVNEQSKVFNESKIKMSIGNQDSQAGEVNMKRDVYRSYNKIQSDKSKPEIKLCPSIKGNSPVKIQIPKSPTRLKKNSSINTLKDDRSELSGTSYIRVSHSKKIKDLQQKIQYLQKKEEAYLKQIQNYTQQLAKLKNQMLISSPSFRLSTNQVKKVITESQVFLEDQKFKSFILENQNKQIENQKKNLRIGELEEEMKHLNRVKNESEQQSRLLQEKVNELLRREDQSNRKVDSLNELIKHLQKQIGQMEQKLRKEKQISQETRISVKEINIHYQNAQAELKKLKNSNQTLQDKVKKLSGSDLVIRDLSKEIEDLGKRALEMTRTINHMKLEKDSNQEELRMLKKRQNDQARIASQWQEKAASLERQIEQQKRKENKLKREIQQGHQDIRRIKLQQKKQEQELQAMNAAQISLQLERRKHLDQITNLQDQLSRKDYEFTKLNKEIQKWKTRAEQKDDLRLGKKSELKEEIQKLQNELIRKQKKLFEQIQQSKLLRSRLQLLQKQNKRIIEQKNQNYGQKLKYYVEEMGNIKKLLDEYQVQNSRLKVENNQLYEQYQMMRVSLDKLQNKYDEGSDREDDILNQLQSYINELNMLKERLKTANEETNRLQFAFNTLQKQNDEGKAQNKKNLQKLQNSERNLQRSLVQIKDYKIKISEYETNFQINNKIAERYRTLERKKIEQDEELKKLKSDYQNAISTYIFRREDLEKAVNQTREHQRKLKLEEIQRIQQDCDKNIASKTKRLQQEILQIYNENSRLRAQAQVLLEQNAKKKGRLTQLQIICSRIDSLEIESEQNRIKLQELRQQVKKKNERITKYEISIEGLNSENNVKDRQLNAMKARMKQLESTIDKLNQEIKVRRSAERQLQDALIRATEKKQRQKSEQDIMNYQREAQMIQQYESKISSLEIQLQRAKEKELRTSEENTSKMKKLQKKMDQMEQALKQKEKAIENHYQGELKELQNSLMRLSQELQEKMIRNEELNEGILILEDENKALIKQIQALRYQSDDDKNIFQSQLLKLKAKLKESESAYSFNLKSLEEELMRATQNKSINNGSNSRVKTNEAQQRISKRYEQKLKNKDRKIQELKQNIYTLQETILKLKKRDTLFESNVAQIERLKVIILDFEKQKKNIQLQFGQESNLNAQLARQLRKEILQLKQKQEKARFLADQKILEFQSVNCELKTIKELYHDLQRDLQKRKNNLAIQLEEESTLQNQFRMQQNKIIDLEGKLLQSEKFTKELQLQLRKKNNQIKREADTNQQLTISQQKLKLEINSLKTQIVQLKKHITQVEASNQSTKNQLKLSKVEISKLRKSQQDLKQICSTKESIASELKRQHDQIFMRYREYEEAAHKYSILNERSREQIGCGIEQIIEKYVLIIDQREIQYNQLIEEIQELKFLNQRKFMDYDEIKKLNFELQLKVEQYETLNDRLQTLRKICDRLQEQKKNSVFREEVLRMQIENLANTGPSQLRTRIEGILAAQVAPSFGNFSFY